MDWPLIPKLRDGVTEFSEKGVNPSLSAIERRTESVRSRLEEIHAERSGIIWTGPFDCDPEVSVGDLVWIGPSGVVSKAYLQFSEEGVSETAEVCGIVARKDSPEQATLISSCSGIDLVARTSIPNLSGLISDENDEPLPGAYYLSTVPGKITRSGGPFSIPVVRIHEGGLVSVDRISLLPRDVVTVTLAKNRPASFWDNQTGGEAGMGWATAQDGAPFVNYLWKAAPSTAQPVQVAIRFSPGRTRLDSDTSICRFEISKSGTDIVITAKTDVDLDNWASTGDDAGTMTIPIPEYGEWIEVNGSGIDSDFDFCFVNADDRASASGVPDLAALGADGTWKFMAILPFGRHGWTNADYGDSNPSEHTLRYLAETDPQMSAVLSGRPGSILVLLDGNVVPASGCWSATAGDLYWGAPEVLVGGDNSESPSYPFRPWSDAEVSADEIPMIQDGHPYLGRRVLSIQSKVVKMSSSDKVNALASSRQIRFLGQGAGLESSTGFLVPDFNAEAGLISDDHGDKSLDWDPARKVFRRSPKVSSIISGPGVTVSPHPTLPSGNFVVSRSGNILDGEFYSAALDGGFEVRKNQIDMISLRAPEDAPAGVSFSMRVPRDLDFGIYQESDLALYLRFMVSGSSSVAGSAQAALKIGVRVVNPGTNLISGQISPVWTSAIPVALSSYTAGDVLEEIPRQNILPVSLLSGIQKPSPGSVISIHVSRESNSPAFNIGAGGGTAPNSIGADDLPGDLNLIGARWEFKLA